MEFLVILGQTKSPRPNPLIDSKEGREIGHQVWEETLAILAAAGVPEVQDLAVTKHST